MARLRSSSATVTTRTDDSPVLTSPIFNTGISGSAILDEDNLAGDSDTKLATQQSIKAYVDGVGVQTGADAQAVGSGDSPTFAGATLTGAITTNSTFDGRDVAADGVTADAALPKSGGAMTGAITTNSTFDGVDIATRDGVLTSTTTTAGAALPKAGGAMTGAITTNSTFDGRDVATDGTKLDGIEASATADQTAAQLLTAIKTVDGSGSGLDADLLDGLQLHTGVNNEANKVVRTQANGYADFGWINTVSGVATGTPTRIYCSQDSYLRYYTPASLAPYILNQGSTKNSHTHTYLPLSGGTLTGDIVSNARSKGVFGSYSSYLTDHIWSMGTSYRNHASGTNFGNLYGLAYKHTNNSTGGTMADGHMMVWCQNGGATAAMGSNIWTSGNVTAYSDARVKENLEVIPNALDKVKQLNGYTYDRTDLIKAKSEEEDVIYDHNPKDRHVGLTAQELLEVLPEAVTGGPNSNAGSEDDHYSIAYGNVVALLVEAIKEQQIQIDELKSPIK